MPGLPHDRDMFNIPEIAVLGAGDPAKTANYQSWYRMLAARKLAKKLLETNPKVVVSFYGTRTGTLEVTEATAMHSYWLDLDHVEGPIAAEEKLIFRLYDDAEFSNTSLTCRAIVKNSLSRGVHVYLVMNHAYMYRTANLLWRHATKQGLLVTDVAMLAHFVPCEGFFDPALANNPVKKWLKAIRNPILYELGAWTKNYLKKLP